MYLNKVNYLHLLIIQFSQNGNILFFPHWTIFYVTGSVLKLSFPSNLSAGCGHLIRDSLITHIFQEEYSVT